MASSLPAPLDRFRHVLAVVAHPDDESFGLGALLAALADAGATVHLVCFTVGEASTLGATEGLSEVRRRELVDAAAELGVQEVWIGDFPDGRLAEASGARLDEILDRHVAGADVVVAFERDGVTGHPDHKAATAAARRAADRHRLPLLEWGVSPPVASALRRELGVPFVALDGPGVVGLVVDRCRQWAAIACHRSQSVDNPVLARRLELQGNRETVRVVAP